MWRRIFGTYCFDDYWPLEQWYEIFLWNFEIFEKKCCILEFEINVSQNVFSFRYNDSQTIKIRTYDEEDTFKKNNEYRFGISSLKTNNEIQILEYNEF